MSLQRKKFALAYNRAKEKLHTDLSGKEYDDSLYDSGCHEEHEYTCSFCSGPFIEDIRLGYLGLLLHKLNIRSAKSLSEYF